MASDEELFHLHERGMSYEAIADELGFKRDGVKRRVNRHKQAMLAARVLALEAELEVVKRRQEDEIYEPSSRDIDDTDQWRVFVASARTLPRMLKIQFWPDFHIPDTNWQAVELAYQIAADFQPDLHLFCGDEFDFDTLSTHWARAENRRRVDAFKEVRRGWNSVVDTLDQITPLAAKAMLGGNHTRGRVEAYVNEKAAEIADTVIETFIDLARSNNRVMWLGWSDEMWISDLHVEHGERTGENSAKNSLKDLGWASPRVGAHVHAPSWFVNYTYSKNDDLMSASRHIVESMTLPCLCNIHPQYRYNRKKSRWMNGIGVAHINLQGFDVHLQKFIFHDRADGSMATVFGERAYIQPTIALAKSA